MSQQRHDVMFALNLALLSKNTYVSYALLPAKKGYFHASSLFLRPLCRAVLPLLVSWLCLFVVFFSQFSTRQQRLPPGVQIFRSEAHVSVLTSSVQGMAQLFSCRVKCCIQLSVLRTIFLLVSTHFSRQRPAIFVSCERSM